MNPTTRFPPAIGLVDVSYSFSYNGLGYVGMFSYLPTPTAFIINVLGFNSSNKLTRLSANYLAVSNNLTDFFIWIDFTNIQANQ